MASGAASSMARITDSDRSRSGTAVPRDREITPRSMPGLEGLNLGVDAAPGPVQAPVGGRRELTNTTHSYPFDAPVQVVEEELPPPRSTGTTAGCSPSIRRGRT